MFKIVVLTAQLWLMSGQSSTLKSCINSLQKGGQRGCEGERSAPTWSPYPYLHVPTVIVSFLQCSIYVHFFKTSWSNKLQNYEPHAVHLWSVLYRDQSWLQKQSRLVMRAVLCKAFVSFWNIRESTRRFSSVFKISCQENSKGTSTIFYTSLVIFLFISPTRPDPVHTLWLVDALLVYYTFCAYLRNVTIAM